MKLGAIKELLLRADNHTEKVNKIFIKDLKVSKVELDELWTFVKNQFQKWQVLRKNGGYR